MKKVLSLFMLVAVLAVAFGSLAVRAQATPEATAASFACPDGTATVRVGGGSVGAELEVGQQQAAAYMALCPNITVEFVNMPDSTTDRLGIYQQMWEQQGSDIDVLQTDVIWAGIIAPHVVDLNNYLTPEQKALYFPAMLQGQTINGRLVAIPFFTDAAGLYYRTDLLAQYNVAVPTTWDELQAAAQTIQDGERAAGNADFYGYVWQGNAYEGLTCDAHEWLVSETGNSFIEPDGTVNVTDPAWLAALDRAKGWVGGISPAAVTTYQEEESRAVWQAGNAAFMRNWPYAYGLGNATDSVIAGKFGYAPLPAGANSAAACLGGWQLAVSAYSQHIDASVSVAAFMTNYDQQMYRALSPQGANPTIPALYTTPELMANPLFQAMGAILPTAVARPSGVTAAQYGPASQLFYTAVHDVLTGASNSADAMDQLNSDLTDLVAALPAS